MLIALDLMLDLRDFNTPQEIAELSEYDIFHSVECEYPEMSTIHKKQVTQYVLTMMEAK